MKKFIKASIVILGFMISKPAVSQDGYYGKKIDDSNAITMQELVLKMNDQKSLETKVTGRVVEVCQEMGCWMTLDKGDGTSMRVRMKGHSFFLPKNSAGKTAVIQGKAEVEITSVEDLQHYAEDAGKSKDEIAAIKEPETELVFEAEGVILK
jgi:uncharacterized protein DUF4920